MPVERVRGGIGGWRGNMAVPLCETENQSIGFFKGLPCGGELTGGFIPFQTTKAEREA